MRKRSCVLVSLLGAASLTLALALTGCGQAADTGAADTEEAVEAEEAAEEEATEDEAAGDEAELEFEIPDNLSAATRAPSDLVSADADELEATDLSEFPEGDEESIVEDKGTVEEDSGDASKAPTNAQLVTVGGMSFYRPNSWYGQWDGEDYIMMSADGGVVGYVQVTHVPSGSPYDLASMAEAVTYRLSSQGFTNIKVTDRGTGKTPKGRLVDAFIQVEFTDNGTRCVGYYEYLQSKTYITYLALAGEVSDWNRNADGAALIVNTVGFAKGQAFK